MVQAVRVLLGDDHGADAGEAFDQAFRAEQVQGLPDRVAGGAVVGGEGGLVGEGAVRESDREELVAQQVGQLAGLVRTQPTPRAVGGDGGRALACVVSEAVGGWHVLNHTETVGKAVLRECCATNSSAGAAADLGGPASRGKICHRGGREAGRGRCCERKPTVPWEEVVRAVGGGRP